MHNLKIILFFCFFILNAKATAVKTAVIYFDVAKANIKTSEIEKLEQLTKANQLFLIGHTDTDGDLVFNKNLSKQRVESVLNYFLKNGMSQHKIAFEYFGEEKPLNQNTTIEEKAKNRRVEIQYIIDPLMDFEVESQFFDVIDNEETKLKGKDGTEIIIPANTFDAKNVKLELKEFYSTLDILSSNLSTKANEEMLESSGMVFLEATSNGEKLQPKNDITIKFKKMSESQSFQLFEGNREKATLDMNWNAVGEKSQTEDVEINNKQIAEFPWTWDSKYYVIANWYWSFEDTLNLNHQNKKWNNFFKKDFLVNDKNLKCFDNTEIEIYTDRKGYTNSGKTKAYTNNSFCDSTLLQGVKTNLYPKNYSKISKLKINFKIKSRDPIKGEIDSLRKKPTKENLERALNLEAEYETNFILTNTSKLGWINCDRFLRNIPKTDFIVKVSDEMNVRMVVKSFNSFYNGHGDYTNKNQKVFTKIPFGEEVTLICTSYKNGKILLAIEETKIGKAPFADFNFEVVSKEELKQRIEKI